MTSGQYERLAEKTEKAKPLLSVVSIFTGLSIGRENGVPGDKVSAGRNIEQLACGREGPAFAVHGDEVVG